MSEKKKIGGKVDPQEFELPETTFVRDIENRVVQQIILQCLSKIEGISLLEGNFIDHILGRTEGVKGITAEQDAKNHSIGVKVEVNIAYGISIPKKAEEIQAKVAEELTKITGLHVAQVHVVFKGLISAEAAAKAHESHILDTPPDSLSEEYSDDFE